MAGFGRVGACVALVGCVSCFALVRAECNDPYRFRTKNDEGLVYIYTLGYYGPSEDTDMNPIPVASVSNRARGVFWALGSGNVSAEGLGDDCGPRCGSAVAGGNAAEWWITDQGYSYIGGDFSHWAEPSDGCIENAGSSACMAALLTDCPCDRSGFGPADACSEPPYSDCPTGYFALLVDDRNAVGFYDFNEASGATVRIDLAPVPPPVIVGDPVRISATESRFSFTVGEPTDPGYTRCAGEPPLASLIENYRLYVHEGAPDSRDLTPPANWTQVADASNGTFTDVTVTCGSSDGTLVHFCATLVLNDGTEIPYCSADAVGSPFVCGGPTASGAVPDGNSVPGSLVDIAREPNGDLTLTWGASCLSIDTDYAIYEGTIGDYDSHSQKLCGTSRLETATITPESGDRYYLVVPLRTDWEGSYGTDRAGMERPPATNACRTTQSITSCPP